MGISYLTGIFGLIPMLAAVSAFVWYATGMNPIQQMFAKHERVKDE